MRREALLVVRLGTLRRGRQAVCRSFPGRHIVVSERLLIGGHWALQALAYSIGASRIASPLPGLLGWDLVASGHILSLLRQHWPE